MLGKVLKYDLKSLGKSLCPLYLGLLVMAAVLRLTTILGEQVSFFTLISNFMMVFFIILVVGSFFYTFFVTIKRYYKNLYGDEGYLTHTLPVKTSSLLLSKVIVAAIYIVATTLISALSLLIAFDLTAVFDIVKQIIVIMSGMFMVSEFTVCLLSLLFLFLGYMTYIVLAFASTSLGHMHNSNKLIMSVVYAVGLYYVGQVISLIFLGFMFINNPNYIDLLNQAVPPTDIVNQLMIFSFSANVLLVIIYYFISLNRLKQLNIG